MAEQRDSTRYQSSAKATLEGSGNKEALLKDISITGCRLVLTAYVSIAPNKRYKLKIVPESTAGIEPFLLIVESKWIVAGANSNELGFSIVKSPRGKQFQRYVDYLSWRYSQGSSMIGGGS
jgi:hypothetical protein